MLYVGTGPIGVMTLPPYTGGLLGPTITESSIFVSWSVLPGNIFPAASACSACASFSLRFAALSFIPRFSVVMRLLSVAKDPIPPSSGVQWGYSPDSIWCMNLSLLAIPRPKLSNSLKIIVEDGVHWVFFFIRFLRRASSWGISRFQGRLRGSTGSPFSVSGGGGKGFGWKPTPGLRPRRLIGLSPSPRSSQSSSLRIVGLLPARPIP